MNFRVVLLLALVPLAGCIDGDSEPNPAPGVATPAWQVANGDPFFANATVPGAVDLDLLSKPIYDILPVQEIIVTMSDGAKMHNAVYLPATEGKVPIFINFSPYWGNTAETMGDNFASYMIDNFVPRGYAVILSAVRGTGHSEGCFEVASDRESMDVKEVVDYFAASAWSNGNVAAGGKSYDSTTQNGMIAKFPSDNLKAVFHVSGITDMYEYTFHNGLWARIDAGLFSTTYSVGQGINEGVDGGEGGVDQDKVIRTTGDATCTENPETVAVPASTYATGLKTPYWQERDWTTSIGQSSWNGSIFFYHGFQDWNVQPSHILPWLNNLPEDVRTKVWLHQDAENGGHLYPMRTDWNVTMLRWLDSELKGIDTGFWAEPRNELEGTDRNWRAMENWPAQRIEVATTAAPRSGPGASGHVVTVDLGNFEGDVRVSGQATLQFDATSAIEDPQITAVFYVDGAWVGEAAMRGIYRNGVDAPTPIVPGTPTMFTLTTYPFDVVIPEGSTLTIETQAVTRHTLTQQPLLSPVIVDMASYVLELPLAGVDSMPVQPARMPCIAC